MTTKLSMATPSSPAAAVAMLARYQRKLPNIMAELGMMKEYIVEYKALLMDILDAIEEAENIDALRAQLAGFDIELIEGKSHSLREWWESQHAKEEGRAVQFYAETSAA